MDNDDSTDGTLRVQMVAKFGEASMKDPVHKGLFFDAMDVAMDAVNRLAARVGALESGLVVGAKYMGVYQRQTGYPAGSLCTSGGSLWHCNAFAAPGVEPGDNPSTWTLCAKTAEPPRPQRDTAGKRITGNEPKRARQVEKIVVVRHDKAGRILETRKEIVEE